MNSFSLFQKHKLTDIKLPFAERRIFYKELDK